MKTRILTGDKELDALLQQMKQKSADAIAKAALGGALSATAAGIRKAAPVGETKDLKASIGSRFEKQRGRRGPTAKAGVNVGKMTVSRAEKLTKKWGARKMAPHAHLVGLGTAKRYRKSIGGRFRGMHADDNEKRTTGTMPSNDFVMRGTLRAKARAFTQSRKRAANALQKQVNKELKSLTKAKSS